MKLFVYGTLLSGQPANYKLIEQGAVLIGPDKLKAMMFTTNFAYPFLMAPKLETDEVLGEVYEINDSVLQRCDGYEGYHPEAPAQCLFIRSMGMTLGGHEVHYYHAGPRLGEHVISNDILMIRIESGDWIEFVKNEVPGYLALIQQQEREEKEAKRQARIAARLKLAQDRS